MQRKLSVTTLGGLLLLLAGSLAAQSFTMEREVIAPGGGTWQLDGTLGQPVAGRSSGGVFTLDGGFWVPETPAGPRPDDIFSDGFEETP
jgi:hypothetical protein